MPVGAPVMNAYIRLSLNSSICPSKHKPCCSVSMSVHTAAALIVLLSLCTLVTIDGSRYMPMSYAVMRHVLAIDQCAIN